MARILVVDDETGIREFMVDTLTAAGHDVHQAEDGEKALEALHDQPYDLVLLDLNMPGAHGGLSVLRRARAEWPDMQAIVLTANGTVGTAVEAMRMGAFDFLEKPVEGPEAVRRLVSRALNWRGSSPRPLRDPEAPAVPGPGDLLRATPAHDAEGGSRLQRLLREARRRHVYRVAVTYAAVGFIVLQAAQLILPALPFPDIAYTVLVILVIAGFPVAVILGWVYDLTSSGIRRTRDGVGPESARADRR